MDVVVDEENLPKAIAKGQNVRLASELRPAGRSTS